VLPKEREGKGEREVRASHTAADLGFAKPLDALDASGL